MKTDPYGHRIAERRGRRNPSVSLHTFIQKVLAFQKRTATTDDEVVVEFGPAAIRLSQKDGAVGTFTVRGSGTLAVMIDSDQFSNNHTAAVLYTNLLEVIQKEAGWCAVTGAVHIVASTRALVLDISHKPGRTLH